MVLQALRNDGAIPAADLDSDRLTTAYRTLRREIIGHGREMNSVDGVLETFRRVGIPVNPDHVGPIVHSLFTNLTAGSAPVEGVAELVWQLRDAGFAIGIISNAVHHDFLLESLTRHSLLAAFDVVVSSASSGFYKSDSQIYRDTLRHLGSDPDVSVHIGDSFRWDHLACKSIGMASVWFNESGERVDSDGPLPDLEIRQFAGSAESIQRLTRRWAGPS